MEEYNNYMSLSKALESITTDSVLSELSLGLFTSRALTSARGIIAGYNNDSSGLSNGLYTQLDYNYGRAVALVAAGTPELVVDEQLRRFGFAVASVNGDSSYKLGIHFDQLQLEWAEAVAPFLNSFLQKQTPWLPTDLGSKLLAWYDATDTSTFTIDGSNHITQWRDKSGNNNHLNETRAGSAESTPPYVTFTPDGQCRFFNTTAISIRGSAFVSNNLTESRPGGISSAYGENSQVNTSSYTFVRLLGDYDISIDGGSGNGSSGSAMVNGSAFTAGTNINIPGVTTSPPSPLQRWIVEHNVAQNMRAVAFFLSGTNTYYASGKFGEFMFFSTPLTASERTEVDAWQQFKFFSGQQPVHPLVIQAEDFTSYSDTTPGNEGSSDYRAGTDVDLEPHGNVINVGWFVAGEWLEYEVEILSAGDYQLTAYLAGDISFDGVERTLRFTTGAQTSNVTTTFASSWSDFQPYNGSTNLTLAAGRHTIRATLIDNSFNFDKFVLTKV